MRNLKALLLTACVFALYNPARAGSAGAESFNFLFLDANARAVGLSGAYTALSTDVNALLYNPAGLARVNRDQATFMHNQYFQDITQEYLSYASPKGWGASFNYLSFGDIPNTTISNHTGAGLGSLGVTDMVLSAGYGKSFYDNLSVGAGIKLIRESIDDVSGQGLALDIGALYLLPMVEGLSLGAAVQNIGPKVKFESTQETLPTNLRLGAAYAFEIMGQGSTVSMDFTKERSEDLLTSLGIETIIAKSFPVRLGYNTRNDDGPGVTAGLGYLYNNLSFDYAYAPFKELGAAHRFSVTLFWGGEKNGMSNAQLHQKETPPSIITTQVSSNTLIAQDEIQNLINDLKNESSEIRLKAAKMLGASREKKAVKPLVNSLNDENDRVTANAAISLGQIGDKTAVQPLIDSLKDPSALVRSTSAKSLGILGDKRAVGPLKGILRDEDPSVRKAASAALNVLAN